MAHRRQGPRVKNKIRFLKETSDRSGFDNFDRFGNRLWTSIRDVREGSLLGENRGNIRVAPDEFDNPPPSDESLGGADISGSPRINSLTTDTTSLSKNIVFLVQAGDGISINQEPFMLLAGSSVTTDISSNPQISRGDNQQIKGFKCVSNKILLEDGNGLSLRKSFLMDSGAIINLIYNGTDNLWQELSRSHEVKNLGEL